MPGTKPLTPVARIGFGLLCVACGLPPALAAFDLGPLHSADINGPPWLGLVAGGVFILAGLALILGDGKRQSANGPRALLFVGTIYGCFAAIANWIAFGPGPRACSVSFAGFFFDGPLAGELSCRIGFGIGAVMLNGCLLLMAGAALEKTLGAGWTARAMNFLGLALLGLALAPILLLPLLWLLARGLVAGYAEYRRTGTWPRNENFIARRKARRTTPG